jgi:hypothetical protein
MTSPYDSPFLPRAFNRSLTSLVMAMVVLDKLITTYKDYAYCIKSLRLLWLY